MRKLLAIACCLCGGRAAAQSVPVIFDTDMGNDVDDALALAMLHALESRGECRLIGVTITKDNPWAAPYVDLVNTFYGRARHSGRDGEGRRDAGEQPDDPGAGGAAQGGWIAGLSATAGERRGGSGGGRAAPAVAGGGTGWERGDRAGRLQHQSGAAAGRCERMWTWCGAR